MNEIKYQNKRKKGRLKIFLGMAAGVGKTYAMLEEAQKKVKEGVNVIVGTVNTHGRPETAKLLEGLKQIPEKKILYRDKEFNELDTDALIKAAPQIALIDELAHTDIPGAKHLKRWQDVFEILDEGIDVYTTLNVQHIESFKEIVEEITDVKITETVPDLILEKASAIELVDITPTELLERLKEGKVYTYDLSQIAIQNFFQADRLTALREIALLITAEVVDVELHEMIDHIQKGRKWRTREKMLVGINHDLYSQQLIRVCRRRAFILHAPWTVLYVNDSRALSDEEKNNLNKNLNLARDLGAEVITVKDDDISRGIQKVAEQKGITQIVIGKTVTKFKNPFKKSLLDQLLKDCGNIDINIIRKPTYSADKKKGKPKSRPKRSDHYSQTVYEIVQVIAGAPSTPEMFKEFKEKVCSVLEGSCEIFLKNDKQTLENLNILKDEKEKAVALWAFSHGKEAGFSTSTLPSAKNLYVPLKGFQETLGVLAFNPNERKTLSDEEKRFLYTVSEQLSNYLQRSFSEKTDRENRYLQQVESIYEKVLQTLSKELSLPVHNISRAILELKMFGIPEIGPIKQIEKSVDSLNHLIENAEAMSKLSAGLMSFQKSEHDVNALIYSASQKIQKLLKHHHLRIKVAQNLPKIPFDFSLIEILLVNLLTNAIQYSDPNTAIEIEADVIDDTFVLSVSDEGYGIPEDFMDLIFEKFFRVPGAKSTGLGLGLAIAASIAEIHQGKILVQNRPLRGAKFSLLLPST